MEEIFINREAELKLIEDRLSVLLAYNEVMPLHIIQFYGVGGIGKTTMLKRLEQRCQDMRLPAIWGDASQTSANFSGGIIQQVRNYNGSFIVTSNDLLEQTIMATRALLTHGPAVILLDALDAADDKQITWIEDMLENLVVEKRLFIITASKRLLSFERTMSVARRILPFRLQPFSRDSCDSYLESREKGLDAEVCSLVFEWTHGYPLAVNAMVGAILTHKLDPRKEQDKKQLFALILAQVVERGILSTVVSKPEVLDWYQTMLSLFSIPRRCNLSLMQKLIERFAPHYKLSSSLPYMSLPRRINQVTDVLDWYPEKAGFSVETSIRHMFIMKWKIEDPDRYILVHRFMAAISRQQADEVSGTDRIRYLQEYLYHSAHYEDGMNLQHIIEKMVQEIVDGPLEYFLQFHEDFTRDEELKEILKTHKDSVISLVYSNLARINKQFSLQAVVTERVIYLRDFLYYTILDPMSMNIVSNLEHVMQQVATDEPVEICVRLYKLLARDTKIQEKLGEHFHLLSLLLGP